MPRPSQKEAAAAKSQKQTSVKEISSTSSSRDSSEIPAKGEGASTSSKTVQLPEEKQKSITKPEVDNDQTPTEPKMSTAGNDMQSDQQTKQLSTTPSLLTSSPLSIDTAPQAQVDGENDNSSNVRVSIPLSAHQEQQQRAGTEIFNTNSTAMPSATACASHDQEVVVKDSTVPQGEGEASAVAEQLAAFSLDACTESVHKRLSDVQSSNHPQNRGDLDSQSGAAAAAECLISVSESPAFSSNVAAEGACGADTMADMTPSSSQHAQCQEPAVDTLTLNATQMGSDNSPGASSSSPSSQPVLPSPVAVNEKETAANVSSDDSMLQEDSASSTNTDSMEKFQENNEVLEIQIPQFQQNPLPTCVVATTTKSSDMLGEEGIETCGAEIGMRVKGDMVVIGERGSPSTESSDTKGQ